MTSREGVKAGALGRLLEESNPAVRALTLTDVLGRPAGEREVMVAREALLASNTINTIRKAQGGRGYWPPAGGCYNPKFTASVWQLMLLAEMGTPRTAWIESAIERFLGQHQMESGALSAASIDEEARWRRAHGGKGDREGEPCLAGNMLRTLLVFGYGEDPRVKKVVDWLPELQLPDGGWNCDYPARRPRHSSFMSTIEPLWGYSEIPRQRWTRKMKRSIEHGAEFLLAHRIYKSHHDWRTVSLRDMGDVFEGELVTMFHFPMYYYYDALHALRVLTKLGYQDDERIGDAMHLMLSKRSAEGKWILEGDWVRERRAHKRRTLVAIEEINRPSKWITLNCYRVLANTGRLALPSGAD